MLSRPPHLTSPKQAEEENFKADIDGPERKTSEKRKLEAVRKEIERLTALKHLPGTFDITPYKKWLVQGDIKKIITRKITNMKDLFKLIDTNKVGYLKFQQMLDHMPKIRAAMNLSDANVAALQQHLEKYYKDTKVSEAVFYNILRLF